MARMEQIEADAQVTGPEDDADFEMRLWLTAGKIAQNFTILGLLASACAILIAHS